MSSTTLTREVPLGERPPSHNFEYADAAARTGAVGLTPADIGKVARQLDTGHYYVLEDDAPLTWGSISAGISTGGAVVDNTIVRWDGVTGLLIKDSGITIDNDDKVAAEGYTGVLAGTLWSIKATPTGPSTAALLRVEADGANWAAGTRVLEIVSDDADAVPLAINDGAADVFTVARDGRVAAEAFAGVLAGSLFSMKATAAGASTPTIMRLEADGAGWGAGGKVLELVSDSLSAYPLSVNNGLGEVYRIDQGGNVIQSGQISMSTGIVKTMGADALGIRVNGVDGLIVEWDAALTSPVVNAANAAAQAYLATRPAATWAHGSDIDIGGVLFYGANSTPARYQYGGIIARALDHTAASEDGQIVAKVACDGALKPALKVSYDTGLAAPITEAFSQATPGYLGVTTNDAHGAAAVIGSLIFYGLNDAGPAEKIAYGQIDGYCTDDTDGAEMGGIVLRSMLAGSLFESVVIAENYALINAFVWSEYVGDGTTWEADGLWHLQSDPDVDTGIDRSMLYLQATGGWFNDSEGGAGGPYPPSRMIHLLCATDGDEIYPVLLNDGVSDTFILHADGSIEMAGDLSLAAGVASILKAGAAKGTTDLLTLTNAGNAVDMDGTGTAILFQQYYYDAGTPAVADAARIAALTETDWTSAAASKDAALAFSTVVDGAMTERLRLASNGTVTIKAGGLLLETTARVYRKMIVPSHDLSVGGTAPDQAITGNYLGYSYDINDDSVFTTELPRDWEAGTNVLIMVDWYINEAYAIASGEVRWQAAWSAIPHDMSEAVDAPTHTGTPDSGDINIPATAKTMTSTTVGTIAGASLSAGDDIGITLKRIALVGGTDPTADPVVINMYLKYTSNSLGDSVT